MFYVLEIELRTIGTIKVLNDGEPFILLESAQMYFNEIYSENSKDMCDFFELKILSKDEFLDNGIYDISLKLL